jgi:hypothetical protein
MKRIYVLLTCAATLLASACGSDSSLPVATGKGSIRAINAIQSSQEIRFLIEERSLGAVAYQEGSSPAQYDDLNYTFNFEVFYAGEAALRRIASQNIDVVADKNYTLLINGTLSSPAVTVWEDDERTFETADTVFGAKFAHASASLGALDYYFADPAVVPTIGNQVATLSIGEISSAADFPEGDFVLTITSAGNPGDVLYTSDTTSFPARDTYLLVPFDGDASNTAPVFVRALSDLGGSIAMPDVNNPPTVQFVNGSMDLGISDIYGDETLTSLLVVDHDFLDVSADIDVVAGANNFFYTPAGDTSVVSIETALTAFGGLRYRILTAGSAGNLGTLAFIPDIRPVGTGVKVLPYHTSNNFDFLDLYAVEADGSIDEVNPIRSALATGQAPASQTIPAGTYDVYVTDFGEKVALAGPYRIDTALGDVVDLLIVDTIDPAVLDILFLSGGPTP